MISLNQIKNILSNNDPNFIEKLAQESSQLTRQFFGRTMSLYTPLYLSNFCSSHCTYCGFNSHNRIKRFKLTLEQMHQEMSFLSQQGIENILLLTGESYQATPLSYLKEAVLVAKQYFPSISLEVHPTSEEEYKQLFLTGVDGIAVYQETYDRKRYREVHLSGTKSDYDFRLQTAHRAARAGIRHMALGILLGLSDPAEDILSLLTHLRSLEKEFPGVEYSVSFPRFRPIRGENFAQSHIDDLTLIKVICLTRLNFPRVGINLSTREKPQLRDHLLEIGVTRLSAGSNTSVGGYTIKAKDEQDPQFDTEDKRSVLEIIQLLKDKSFDPVLTDWRRIPNEVIS